MRSRILVISGALELLELCQERLTEEGYQVALYSSGLPALDEIGALNPVAIILDCTVTDAIARQHLLQDLARRSETARISILPCLLAAHEPREIDDYLHSLIVMDPNIRLQQSTEVRSLAGARRVN